MLKTDAFDYDLPEELIAQYPVKERSSSRLMCIDRSERSLSHRSFCDIIDYVREGDLLVLNDTRVFPARLFMQKQSTGAQIELLLIEEIMSLSYDQWIVEQGDAKELLRGNYTMVSRWKVLIKPSRRMKVGDRVFFGGAEALDTTCVGVVPGVDAGHEGMERIVDFYVFGAFREKIGQYGSLPLPPYIKRKANADDEKTYQTVFADKEGAIAAPTAGLHFDASLLQALKDRGVEICYVTLHVGYGTFKPVTEEYLEDHPMHTERVSISDETAVRITQAKKAGHRIIACGTTVVRTLESATIRNGCIVPGERSTNIFIYPPFRFQVIDAMITNFHLPRSTLFMLVCAWAGTDLIKQAYANAVNEQYRFYSYGDAMFIP